MTSKSRYKPSKLLSERVATILFHVDIRGMGNLRTFKRYLLECSSGSVEFFMFHGILEVRWNFRQIWWNFCTIKS